MGSEQGAWSDIYSLSGVLYYAVTGQAPPDAIARMKADTMAKGLGAARMRYSAHFCDALAWGLAMEENARPRSVAQWREVLFGQKSMPAQPRPATAAFAKPATQQAVSDEAKRAIAIASAIADARSRSEKRESSPLRWITPAILIIAVAVIGLRVLPGKQPKQQTPPVRVIAVTPLTVPQPLPAAVALPPPQSAPLAH
jgi:hypothetical protein